MKSYVIDASVVTKCFIIEDYSDKAMEVIDAHVKGHLSLSAPSLIVYEIGNVFWKHPQISTEKAYTFIQRFLDLQISLVQIWSDSELLKNVCTLARARNVTFYDASYLTLAERGRTRLVTADENMQNRASNTVMLLKEFDVIKFSFSEDQTQ